MPLISLTTDFGRSDWFVGTMKGVILSIAPGTELVDLTHDIRQGGIREGAFALGASSRYFPLGTIHLVVVDPGVGSGRGAIVVESGGHRFVAPDNGVLSMAVPSEAPFRAHRLENEDLFLHPMSHTFHGRDVFAPVAAHLAKGVPIESFGSPVDTIVRQDLPQPSYESGGIDGEIAYIDHFGNAITNLPSTLLGGSSGPYLGIQLHDGSVGEIHPTYASVAEGRLVAIVGSFGMIEIAIRNGSAEKSHRLAPSQPVRLLKGLSKKC